MKSIAAHVRRRALSWGLVAGLALAACQVRHEATKEGQTTLPATEHTQAAWQSGYRMSDTTEYSSGGMSSAYALLWKDNTFLDTIDTYFGVHFVGRDSLVVWPVAHISQGGGYVEGAPDAFTLLTPAGPVRLRDQVPFLNDFYSSPALIGHEMHYWCLAQSDEPFTTRLLACRADLATGTADSLFLEKYVLETDDWGHLRSPRQEGRVVVFERAGKRWEIDPVSWQIVDL